jgi:hypothetical protein
MNTTIIPREGRLHEIDQMVMDAGYCLNASTMRFERVRARESDSEPRSDCAAETFRRLFLAAVSKEELWEFLRWKRGTIDGRFPIASHGAFRVPAEA